MPALFLFLGLAVHPAAAQEVDSLRADSLRADSLRADTVQVNRPPADSLRRAAASDSTQLAAGRRQAPSPPGSAAGAGATGGKVVNFSARDSLIIVFNEERGDVATLYGQAKATYKEIKLDAYTIELLMARDELVARGLPVDTGVIGRPHFRRGQGEAFTGSELAYNLRTERGRVVGARTQMQEGFVQGEVVAYANDSTLYIADGQYTTCDCALDETPSYSLRSPKMKLQGDWVYTGPIQLYIFNIPTPLWLPFGVLPAFQGRHGGFLPPKYGEDRRGFYLKDWGWYWAINDYMDFQVRFGLWSRGSWSVNPRFRYSKRYKYDGSLSFDYINSVIGEPVDPDYQKSISARLRWSHQQDFNPTTRLSGDVNLGTTNYLRFDSEDYDDRVRQRISSNINFSKRWAQGDRSLSLRLSQQQLLTTGRASLTLPSLTFNQAHIRPFEREDLGPGQERRWYERITISGYDLSLRNDYTFDPLPDTTLINRGDSAAVGISWYEALLSPSKYHRATGDETPFDFSATHRTGLSAPFTLRSLPLIGRFHLNVSPNISYQEDWYFRTVRKVPVIIPREGRVDSTVVERRVTGFFARREFNLSLSANTTIYGLFPIKVGAYEGLRHTLRPSLSFSYRPNYATDFWGYTRSYENFEGERVRYDIRTGRIIHRSTSQRTLGLSLDNVFETKRVRVDSTGERQTETLQVLNLNLSSGYNFAADSLNFSDINLSLRSALLDDLFNFRLTATLSPYVYRNNRLVNRFVLSETGFWPVRLSSLNITAGIDFEGGEGGDRRADNRLDSYAPAVLPPPTFRGGGLPLSRRGSRYTDFSIPWSLDLNLYYRLTNRGEVEHTANLDASFNFNLTPKWKIDVRTGFDFDRMELATTAINVVRDFECWQMTFNWTPFGRYQQYGFSLYVKSGKLRNLLRLNLPNSNVKGRFRGAVGGALRGGGAF